MSKRLLVLTVPLLAVGMLQLTGCVRRQLPPPPPGGAYLSTSGGAQFDQSVNLVDETGAVTGYIAEFPLQHLQRTSHNPEKIYAVAGTSGVAVSSDGGQTWQQLNQPLNSAAAVAELANETILVSGSTGENEGVVMRSLDRGVSWEKVLTIPQPKEESGSIFQIIKPPPPPPIVVASMVSDPHRANEVYATTSTGEILVGSNSGKTWQTVVRVRATKANPFTGRSDEPVRAVIPSPHNANEVLVITSEGGLVRTTRDGQQERYNITVGAVLDARYVLQFPGSVFVGTTTGAFVARDLTVDQEGELNLPISKTTPLNAIIVRVSPTNPSRLLVGVNNVLYRSEDGGQTWNALAFELPNHVITDISIDPTNAARVLLITAPVRV